MRRIDSPSDTEDSAAAIEEASSFCTASHTVLNLEPSLTTLYAVEEVSKKVEAIKVRSFLALICDAMSDTEDLGLNCRTMHQSRCVRTRKPAPRARKKFGSRFVPQNREKCMSKGRHHARSKLKQLRNSKKSLRGVDMSPVNGRDTFRIPCFFHLFAHKHNLQTGLFSHRQKRWT